MQNTIILWNYAKTAKAENSWWSIVCGNKYQEFTTKEEQLNDPKNN